MEPTNREERRFLASYRQVRDFVSSVLWIDLQTEIKSWIDDIHGYLENETDVQEIYRFQGRLQSCKQLLTLPERILSTMEATQEALDQQSDLTIDLDISDTIPDEYYQEQLRKWSMEDIENV